jgi:hypothetical protein
MAGDRRSDFGTVGRKDELSAATSARHRLPEAYSAGGMVRIQAMMALMSWSVILAK